MERICAYCGKENTAKNAMEALTDSMRRDPDYAWGWHCNIACLLLDEGVEYGAANKRAASFMKLAFDVDTTNHIKTDSTDYKWEEAVV